MGSAVGNAFFLVNAPMAVFVFFNSVDDSRFVLSEVDDPGVGGVEVVGFDEVEGFKIVGRERISRLEAEEESVLFGGERFEGVEGVSERGLGMGIVESGAIRAVEIRPERGGVLDSEGGKIVAVEAESGVAFEFVESLPVCGLEKMG